MDMQFWNDSASLFHCGMSSLSLFSLLWQPALGESVTKVPPTCPSPAQKQGLFPFISSLLHPQNILATSIICVGHDSLRGLISFYYLCKLSICSWISLSSPALWCYSLYTKPEILNPHSICSERPKTSHQYSCYQEGFMFFSVFLGCFLFFTSSNFFCWILHSQFYLTPAIANPSLDFLALAR